MNKKYYFLYFTILLVFFMLIILDIPKNILINLLPLMFSMIFFIAWITIKIYHFNIKFHLYLAWKSKIKKLTFKSKEANITLIVWLIIVFDLVFPTSFFIFWGLFLTMFLPNILFTILGFIYLLFINEIYKFLNNLVYFKKWKLLSSLTRHNNLIILKEVEEIQKTMLFITLLINIQINLNLYFQKEYQHSYLNNINLIKWQKQGTKPPRILTDLFL